MVTIHLYTTIYRYQAYCYREEVIMRKALYVLNKYKEESQAQRLRIRKIHYNSAYSLVKNTFYTWVQKYQYRVTRRPMLIKALNFWGNNTIQKAFKGWRQYRENMKLQRKKLRTFWCIRAAIDLIDNSSIYDKIAYPSQALRLPIKHYDPVELEITVNKYDHLYKQKLFKHWKNQYIRIRNYKAKFAYKFIKMSFGAWRQYANRSKQINKKLVIAEGKMASKTLKK